VGTGQDGRRRQSSPPVAHPDPSVSERITPRPDPKHVQYLVAPGKAYDELSIRARVTGRGFAYVTKRELARYWNGQRLELGAIHLDARQADLLYRAGAGLRWDERTYDLLWRYVHELDKRLGWRIRRLSPLQLIAVIDGIERASVLEGEPADRMRAAGFDVD
jgi:hypothetical protein